MSYHLQSEKKKKARGILLGTLFAVSLLFAAFFHVGPPRTATGFLHYVGLPFWKIKYITLQASASVLDTFQSKTHLARKNRELEEELTLVRLKILDRNLLFEENLELKELLGRNPSDDLVVARVLAKPNISPYDTFILDVGKRHGIGKGDRVLVAGTVVVGEVDTVFAQSSRAKLFSSPGEKHSVLFAESSVTAIAHGRGGGNFEVRLPRAVDVVKNERIVVPGIDGLILGIVEEIIANPEDSFQTVLFKSPVNVSEITTVLVERSAHDAL